MSLSPENNQIQAAQSTDATAVDEAKTVKRFADNFRHDVHVVMLCSLLMLLAVYLDDGIMLLMKSPHGLPDLLALILGCDTAHASEILVALTKDDLFVGILSLILQLLMLLIPALIARLCLKSKPNKVMPLSAKLPPRAVAFAALTFGTCYSCNMIFILLFGSYLPNIHTLSLTSASFEFVSIVIIAPIFEELVFRGIFFRSLEKYSRTFAIIFTALLFGLMHRNPASVVNAAIFGFFSAVACAETGSLLMGIILHMTNNALSVIATSAITGKIFWLVPVIALFNLAMICIALALYAGSKGTNTKIAVFSRPRAYDIPRVTAGEGVIAVISTPWTWLFLILLVYSVFLLYI